MLAELVWRLHGWIGAMKGLGRDCSISIEAGPVSGWSTGVWF